MRKGNAAVVQYQDQIEKGIGDDTFIRLSDEEIESLKSTPHHYTLHFEVFSQNSATAKVRLVANTLMCVTGKVATISTEQICPHKTLNNQLNVLYRHACNDTPS